ncbi:hypothetical protein PHLGIDRAFT_307553 [Phlebiopsis gigantea 11061_1 CR5-6]|uniref:WD40 repeat-like protein n=1 Tax=Phlebiopsis gigantea (strain 11061_1 CR5-6) TaxID=745531 RepID=A0A0C3PR65_PHLG1|nr:hypothetical protein PHLGIDRAFT_307553 [Phlebiopsis gigantea 11061_1 CR5-6]
MPRHVLTHSSNRIWNIISIGDHRCYDVRAAHLLGHSLVLGAAKRGILLPDIQAGWSFDILPTDSDVLAVYQLENVIYTGARNGSIHRFDRRLSSRQKGQELFRNRFTRDTRSITHISAINEAQMLVSTVKGDLELLDLRFARIAEPVMSFDGHVNSYTTNLGITTSPCSSYVFAAGQDQRIRAWSLLTGELISPPLRLQQSSNADCVSLFQHALEGPISAIQVTEGGGGGGASANGMTLWAASGKKVYRFWLGQRLDDAALKY